MDEIRVGELSALHARPSASVRGKVLMVHGWWGGAWVWDRFMGRFAAAGYDCYAVNLRGQHNSRPVPDVGKISFADHLDDVRATVSALGHPYLVTHSFGGLLSLKLAEEVTLPAVVNLVPVPPRGFFSFRTFRVMAPYLVDMIRGRSVLPGKRTIFDADLNRLAADERESTYARMVPASGKQGIESVNASVDPARVRGPRLIVSGTDDRLIPCTIHRKLATRFDADYREYPNRAHYIMREPGWEQVADDVIEWLDRVKLAGRN